MAKILTGLSLLLLAGCLQEVDPMESIPLSQFSTWEISTTPNEAFDLVGKNYARFGAGTMLLQIENEDDLAQYIQATDEQVYISYNLLGFYEYSREEAIDDGMLSPRISIWDLPRHWPEEGQKKSDSEYHANSVVTHEGADIALDWVLRYVNGLYTKIELNGSAREAPFTFERSNFEFDWTMTNAMTWQAAKAADEVQDTRHRIILDLIDDYVATNGQVPQDVDEETLRVQLLISGESWPQNTYTDQPMRNDWSHGNFQWIVCTNDDATYIGWGWDAQLMVAQYGSGCQN